MPVVKGFFDARTRAFVAVGFPNSERATLQIDTGFNGAILVGDQTADRLGLPAASPSSAFVDVLPAGSAQAFRVRIAEIDVPWLGQVRTIGGMIYPNEAPRPRGEPEGLLGTGLVHPNRLLLDYLNDIVEIGD